MEGQDEGIAGVGGAEKAEPVGTLSESALPPGFFELTAEERESRTLEMVRAPAQGMALREAIRDWYTNGDPQMVRAFTEIIERDSDVRVRRTAFAGLAHIPDRAAVPGLLRGLQSTDRASRYHAIAGLERLRAREAVPGLLSLLDDRRVRLRVARALVVIRDERALEPLRAAARHGWPRTRARLQAHVHELETSLGYQHR